MSSLGRRAGAVGVTVLTAALIAFPALGGARSSLAPQKSPAEPALTVGLSGASQLTAGQSSDEVWASRAHTANTKIVRLEVGWSLVAPSSRPRGFRASNPASPSYDWTNTDAAVKELTRDGFSILITVTGAPTWAEGAHVPAGLQGAWKPNAQDLGQFARAIAARYSGSYPDPASPRAKLPRVRYWQPWNEPNLGQYLSPTWVKTGRSWTDQGAVIYRSMLDAFYGGVKSVSASNYVVMAATAPYGDAPGTEARIPPLSFFQDVFCLTDVNKPTGRCPNPAEFDAVDHHPYVSGRANHGPTWHAVNLGDVAIPDLRRLTDALRAAERYKTVRPAGRKSFWVTEIAWQTSPPQPKTQGVTPAQGGLWAEQALYILWSEGARTIFWFQLADDPESSAGWSQTNTEGLYYADGAPKPAAAALRFPFVTNRLNARQVKAWGVAPAAGVLMIQERSAQGWVTRESIVVKAGQVFVGQFAESGRSTLRAVVGNATSLSWPQGA